ncbi:hypothetical protein FisN_4Lh338 [Fistulifera solaris]|uniref:DUF4460 domain-containing protein n=1 Tax=Fistulifera solaris TaxID=1519565 RepID=A0A1Z5K030_FISSO|nr:hypothetical protein FisN_4Lh338 [Fistulifera solaris]|eukprot:GAX19361.1 hypothetical protein FisN_4Lh338 [Fistulifera solaris]
MWRSLAKQAEMTFGRRALIVFTRPISSFVVQEQICKPRGNCKNGHVRKISYKLLQPPNKNKVLQSKDWFSSASGPVPTNITSLRSLVKPFLLKCHPDMQQSELSKTVNLSAIQNLNAYLDSIQEILSSSVAREPSVRLFEVDFIMTHSDDPKRRVKNKKLQADAEYTSRRKIELALPPLDLCREAATSPSVRPRIHRHSAGQLLRLLRMASLSVPQSLEDHVEDGYNEQQPERTRMNIWDLEVDLDKDFGARRSYGAPRRETPYEESRRKFVERINWEKYDRMYEKAVADMEADFATRGLLANNPVGQRRMIANVLSKVRIGKEISGWEQLVAVRRLSLLFQQNFELLHMEEFGRLWEKCAIVLTPTRNFNTSPSALHKRRLKQEETGFAFTLHPDFSITIEIPLDFGDEEVIRELERNVWDMYDLIQEGLEDIVDAEMLT